MLAAVVFKEADGRRRAAAGGEHGIEDVHLALGYVLGHLAVILDGLERLGVPVKADVADLRARHELKDAVHHAEAGAEDGHYRHLLAGEALDLRRSDGGLDLYLLRGHIPRRLEAHEARYLAYELAEFLDARVLVPEDGELMLDKRMVHYVNAACHSHTLLYI